MFSTIFSFLSGLFSYLFNTLYYDGLYLFISIFIAVLLTVYIKPEKVNALFLKSPQWMIPGSVTIGAVTPLCACGTMAVVLSLLTTALPWGPIMAFLVSSPLMSPDTFVLLSGFMGIKFAVALTAASIILGLVCGFATHWIEKNTRLLEDQLWIKKDEPVKSCCINVSPQPLAIDIFDCSNVTVKSNSKDSNNCCTVMLETKPSLLEKLKVVEIINSFIDLGIKKVLPLFILFVAIAYLLKTYVPDAWVMTLFSGNHFYSVPLASLIGLPLYISDATVVPLLSVLRAAGASDGTLLAFMISGPATSLGVIGGLNIIMKRRAILLYIFFIVSGSILLGYSYDFLLNFLTH
jgi:uncharacterized protein